MTEIPVSERLKALREKANISGREMARRLEMPNVSSYNHYETRFKKQFLPHDLILKLIPIFNDFGVSSDEVLELGGTGFQQPTDIATHGFAEGASPKIDVSVLLDEPRKPVNQPDDPVGTIKLAIVDQNIQIAATVNASGVDELIRRLQLARQMIE